MYMYSLAGLRLRLRKETDFIWVLEKVGLGRRESFHRKLGVYLYFFSRAISGDSGGNSSPSGPH
jgi:hypothetical protein